MTGTRATRKSGVVVVMTKMVEKIENKHSTRVFMLYGIVSSVASMSLVNRFTMRPIGVESKKRNVPRSIEFRRVICMILVAFMNIATNNKFPSSIIKALPINMVKSVYS